MDVAPNIDKPQEASKRQEKSDTISSLQISKISVEVPNSNLEPKILLVEDNKINVMVTQSMMKQLGHTIDVVNNGVEAVRAVQRRSYGLVLMDVCMPVMNGLQATRIIRSFEETSSWEAAEEAGIESNVPSSEGLQNGQSITRPTNRIPIVAMTANALSESAEVL